MVVLVKHPQQRSLNSMGCPASGFLTRMRDYLLLKTDPHSTNTLSQTDVVDRGGSFLLLGQADRVELPDVMRTREVSSPVLNNQMPYRPSQEAINRNRQRNYAAQRREHMETRLIKTRAKLRFLINEARELGLTGLLTQEEFDSIFPRPERSGKSGEDKC